MAMRTLRVECIALALLASSCCVHRDASSNMDHTSSPTQNIERHKPDLFMVSDSEVRKYIDRFADQERFSELVALVPVDHSRCDLYVLQVLDKHRKDELLGEAIDKIRSNIRRTGLDNVSSQFRLFLKQYEKQLQERAAGKDPR